MSQCPTASATPSTVLDSQPSGLLDATPYISPVASIVWQSQELPLSQLTPRALKRRLDLDSQEEGSPISCVLPPLSRRRLAVPSDREGSEDGGNSIVPSMAPLESRESIVPAAPEGRRTLGFFPKKEGDSVSEETRETSCHEVIKDLVDHLLTLKSGGNSLLEYAMGVTESHDLREEGLNLWKYKGVRPHERLLLLKDDKGRFAPLSAYEYLKKEADAWEARYGTLTEEFLLGQCPAGLKAKTNRNEDFAYAMEAEDAEGFFGRLKERQPCDMAMGYNNLKAFTGYFYRDKGALPQGVCEPKALKKATVNLPPGVQEWVTSNILEQDPESDRGKILVLWGPSETGKSALARSWGHHIRFRQNLNSDEFSDHPMVQYAVLDDMDWSKVPLKMWVQEDFNFHTSYRSERHCQWGRSTVICSNSKPSVFADCSYATVDGKNWIDTNCTFVYIGDKLY
ncbi:Geminivirus Rep catalytic domain [Rhizoctonia solani]|uniref:Geminivirus Rep catalytic domain n=1 Tax=Rhizoctonia solani TaxID=456999 RepID=A0A8H7IK63_9AGAM|nr:Geminivirus Rep catalytic domain [Rhizoctonia solani]